MKSTAKPTGPGSGKALSGPVRGSTQLEIESIKQAAQYLRTHPDKLAALAVEMGIHTKTGRLGKAYGG